MWCDYIVNPLILFEGYIYKKSGEKMKSIYFRLVGKDLYFYKNKEDKKHKGMHNLSGVFAKEGTDIEAKGKKFYCIDIVYPQTKKSYYFDTIETRNIWLEKLQAVIDHKSVTDSYDIFRKIGQGKFGLVKYGKNKETHQSVAIKIMTKKEMDQSDLELAITEINILKMCQHPNTIKLYDVFETADHIYIVMEYCKGGDLFSYIEKRGFRLPEKRAAEIIHKLCTSVYFLHQYGIVHRTFDVGPYVGIGFEYNFIAF